MSSPLEALLLANALPSIDGDKHDRGVAVVVAGDVTCPGAAVLAATAVLRAGAGKVQVLTHPDITTAVGVAVPEALVIGMPPDDRPTGAVRDLVSAADVLLVGPGMGDGAVDFAEWLAADVPDTSPVVLDARALPAATRIIGRELVLIPNEQEALELVPSAGDANADDAPIYPDELAVQVATTYGATVAVRGAETVVTDGRRVWWHSGHPGLGTAGSGDVVAGLVAGFCARGVRPLLAVGWAVGAHATAGTIAAEGTPGYGFLARDVLDAVPRALLDLSKLDLTASTAAGRPGARL
jgi:ADP-dependent NAD(P)H-hydrate dehydratase